MPGTYLPTPRHKTPHKRPASTDHAFFLNFTTRRDAPLVLRERDGETTYAYRLWNDTLYREAKRRAFAGSRPQAPGVAGLVEEVRRELNPLCSFDQCVNTVERRLERFLVVDGHVYERFPEPHYEVNRRFLNVRYGMPEGHSLAGAFNALEYEAARLETLPEANYPRAQRHRLRQRHEADPKRDAVPIRVYSSEAVRIPGHEALCEQYETQEVERAASATLDRLRYERTTRRVRILERCLELTRAE
ncbi:MAG: hypothetical protein HC933_03970, partial [Pleurocapsa sp. SU_196_0]|nr:hypothetical protein [Pleurocapsa sp. SU_196_0]